MKLGFVSAILPEQTLAEVVGVCSRHWLRLCRIDVLAQRKSGTALRPVSRMLM